MDKADDRSVLARREFMKATGAIVGSASVKLPPLRQLASQLRSAVSRRDRLMRRRLIRTSQSIPTTP